MRTPFIQYWPKFGIPKTRKFGNNLLSHSVHKQILYINIGYFHTVFSSMAQTNILCSQEYTGVGRKKETEIIFVVLLQINRDIPNLASNTQAVNYCKQLVYTVNPTFGMSQTICKSWKNIEIRLLGHPCI